MAAGEPCEAGILTRQILKNRSGEFDIESIHTITLSRMDISNISVLSGCTSLERLDLSYNDISKISALGSLSNLLVLDISANRLTNLDGLQALSSLEKLDICGNLIGTTDSLKVLTGLVNLVNLRLQDTVRGLSNPVCMRQSYRSDVTNLLPRLVSLDGEILRGSGADLFALLADLDSNLNDRSTRDGPVKTALLPAVPLPAGYWTLPAKETMLTRDTEAQLRSVLAEFQALNEQSNSLINDAEAKLKKHERV